MQRFKGFLATVVWGSALLLIVGCGSQPEPITPSTPAPVGIEVVNISEKDTATNEITQRKTFNQCNSASPFKAQIQFSQSDSQSAQQELILGASVGGEAGLSEVAKVTIEGKIEQHFATSNTMVQGHEESVTIEVPPHTQQEYVIVWRESRREGTVQYRENGEVKVANYSYRIGLELASTTGRDLPCPEQKANEITSTPTYAPSPTGNPTVPVVPTTPSPPPLPSNTAPGSVLSLGETWFQDGVGLTLLSWEHCWGGTYCLHFRLENFTTQELAIDLNLEPEAMCCFQVQDSQGTLYPYVSSVQGAFKSIKPGEAKGFIPWVWRKEIYDPDPRGVASIDYFIVTVERVSRIRDAKWKVDIVR